MTMNHVIRKGSNASQRGTCDCAMGFVCWLCDCAHVHRLTRRWWQGLTLMNNVVSSIPLSYPHTPPVLSLLSFLSVLQAQRKLSTASPFFFFFFSRKHPKNLISIQHASPAHCIQSRVLTIQSACVWTVCVCVCDGGRQAETGRENPFVFTVNPQGHVPALVNRSDTGTKFDVKRGWYSRSWCGIRILYFKVNGSKVDTNVHLADQMSVRLLI